MGVAAPDAQFVFLGPTTTPGNSFYDEDVDPMVSLAGLSGR